MLLILLLGGAVWLDRHGGASLANTLPACGTSEAIEAVQDAFANAPAGKVLGLKIVDFQNPKEISRTDTEVKCSARVKLNNAHQGEFQYRFYVENNHVFVEARLPSLF